MKYDYWSNFSGQPDVPENYQTITYQLKKKNGMTVLIISQENCKTEEVRSHSENNWKMVMGAMKELVEKNS